MTRIPSKPPVGSQSRAKRIGDANSAPSEVDVEDLNVKEVLADVDAGKLSAQDALDAERAGKQRTTLISQLESRIGGN